MLNIPRKHYSNVEEFFSLSKKVGKCPTFYELMAIEYFFSFRLKKSVLFIFLIVKITQIAHHF